MTTDKPEQPWRQEAKLEWQNRITQKLWHKVSILNHADAITLLKQIETLL